MSSRNHLCDICGQVFVRAEHLSRHRRIHTREKPYPCDYCSERFSRTDLRRRHIVAAHNNPLQSASTHAQKKRPRAKVACNYCNINKLKCSAGRPCERCYAKGRPCPPSQPPASRVSDNDVRRESSQRPGPGPSLSAASPGELNYFDVALVSEFSDSGVGNSPLNEISLFYNSSQVDDDFHDIINLAPTREYGLPHVLPESQAQTFNHRLSSSAVDMGTPPGVSNTLDPFILGEQEDWATDLDHGAMTEATAHNRVILDEFLWLFRDHVAPWLSAFRDRQITITSRTRKEWCFAMAAVGALYCSVQGSWTLAVGLYRCARRRLVLLVGSPEAGDITEKIVTLESYILLQVFGYLSGDTHICESMDSIYGYIDELTRDVLLFSDNSMVDDHQRQRLVETINLCHSYGLVLTQRRSAQHQICPPNSIGALEVLRTMTTPGQPVHPFQSPSESLNILCVLSLFTSVGSPQQHRRLSCDSRTLWSQTFCELALSQWANADVALSDWNSHIFFHAIHMHFLVSMAALQKVVANHNSAGEPSKCEIPSPDCIFVAVEQRPKAVWHGHQILQLAVTAQSSEAPRVPLHFSHCIYFGTLVLWYNAAVEKDETGARQWAKLGIRTLQKSPAAANPVNGAFRCRLKELVVEDGV
ncbi:hypothetical protein BDW59DRAFT_161086 [Aspergillus cavernicola]|uniref:C2H2 type zinc finger domain protein n=1 Tax=Aspergillus cavernicola TaxID=176166 RepID=A0ABR4IER0_9EURO